MPCVLVVIRETDERAHVLEEIHRVRDALGGALEGLGRLVDRYRAAPPPAANAAATRPEASVARLPELSVQQYAALCAETRRCPARAADTYTRYGLVAEEARVRELALADEKVQAAIADKEVVKVLVVKGRLVNVAVK